MSVRFNELHDNTQQANAFPFESNLWINEMFGTTRNRRWQTQNSLINETVAIATRTTEPVHLPSNLQIREERREFLARKQWKQRDIYIIYTLVTIICSSVVGIK